MLDDDYVVLQPDDCSMVHLTESSKSTLGSTQLKAEICNYKTGMNCTQSVGRTVSLKTLKTMTEPVTLKICFATLEAVAVGGHIANDHSMLVSTISQRRPSFFDPTRSIMGAAQLLNVSGGVKGDRYLWTQNRFCVNCVAILALLTLSPNRHCASTSVAVQDFETPATQYKTVPYEFTEEQAFTLLSETWQLFELHRFAMASHDWHLCHQPLDGDWTYVTDRSSVSGQPLIFTLIPKPTYGPLTGVAGSITPLSFYEAVSWSAPLHGDAIVMRPDNCSEAHLVQTGVNVAPQSTAWGME